MEQIKYVEGDLFASVQNDQELGTIVICHVCNDQKKMGSGFVIPLARVFPKARDEYFDWAHGQGIYADQADFPFRRGMAQIVEVRKEQLPLVFVANMVAQTLGGARPLYYNDLARCMDEVAKFVKQQKDGRIVAPLFGAGLAMGRWDFIEELINDCWIRQSIPVTIYYLPGQMPKNSP